MSNRDQTPEPERRLPQDPFTVGRRTWAANPGAAKAKTTIDVQDDYGVLVTWVLETYRADGREVVFLQRVDDQDRAIRLMFPPKVTEALARQRESVAGQVRRKAAQEALETRRNRGDVLGNPAALELARRAPRKPRRRRRARKGAK